MTGPDPARKLDDLSLRRRLHQISTMAHVHELIMERGLQHVLIITQEPGNDVLVHSSWSSKTEELWLLARAQHILNRVLDGELGTTPVDETPSA
jgi:hypothetical protein